jgi:hypothetical protein
MSIADPAPARRSTKRLAAYLVAGVSGAAR